MYIMADTAGWEHQAWPRLSRGREIVRVNVEEGSVLIIISPNPSSKSQKSNPNWKSPTLDLSCH